MKAIEDVNLGSIVQEAAAQILDERKSGVLSLIKQRLNEFNQSTIKISELERNLEKERQKAERLQKWIEEVKSGNWQVIDLATKKTDDSK
jgi:hypothetical protein